MPMDDREMAGQTAHQAELRSPPPNPSHGSVGEAAPLHETVARTQPQPNDTARQSVRIAEHPLSGGGRPAIRWLLAGSKALATLAIALVAILMALVTWDYYV